MKCGEWEILPMLGEAPGKWPGRWFAFTNRTTGENGRAHYTMLYAYVGKDAANAAIEQYGIEDN